MNPEGIRLNKYLSASGVCSRREADRFIGSGRITVNGRTAELGQLVAGNELILLDGRPVEREDKKVVLAAWKEKGIVCSTVDQGREHNNIVDRIGYPSRVYPIGRLDKDTEGLILLTNDGSLVNPLLRHSMGLEKEYLVETRTRLLDEELDSIERGGIPIIEGRPTRPCRVIREDGNFFRIILTEGMNRQVRRLCGYFGTEALSLKRVRFGSITLDGLEPGSYRELGEKEIEELKGK